MAQWLGLNPFIAVTCGFNPCQGTKIPQAEWGG